MYFRSSPAHWSARESISIKRIWASAEASHHTIYTLFNFSTVCGLAVSPFLPPSVSCPPLPPLIGENSSFSISLFHPLHSTSLFCLRIRCAVTHLPPGRRGKFSENSSKLFTLTHPDIRVRFRSLSATPDLFLTDLNLREPLSSVFYGPAVCVQGQKATGSPSAGAALLNLHLGLNDEVKP